MKHHSIFRAFATVFFTFCLASFLQGQATGFTCDRIWLNIGSTNTTVNASGIYNRSPLPANDPFISSYDPNCNCWSSDKAAFSLAKLKHDGKWYLFFNNTCSSSGTPAPYAISVPATDCDPTKIKGSGGAALPNAKWACECIEISLAGTIQWGNPNGIYKAIPLPPNDPSNSNYDTNCNCWSSQSAQLSLAKVKASGEWYWALFGNKLCAGSAYKFQFQPPAGTTGCDPTKIPNVKWNDSCY